MSDWNIIESAEKTAAKVHTKSIDMSLNELADMYESGELIIQPDYQRNFRWSNEQQSRFIESLVLELPVPAIYVIETNDGIYELIDGLQRISSYLHYRGKLPDQGFPPIEQSDDDFDEPDLGEEDDLQDEETSKTGVENEAPNLLPPLVLSGCDIIKDLNGLAEKTMPQLFAIRLKRMPIRVEVIKKDTDSSIKYHLFKRLNTGGEILSKQEIRNCTIRLLNSKFIDFIADCANNRDFIDCIAIPTAKIRKKYDHEVILRFFTFKNARETFTHNIDECLTKYLEDVSSGEVAFDYTAERAIFDETFRVLKNAYEENPRSTFSIGSKKSINVFDAFAQGIQPLLRELSSDPEKLKAILDNIKTINEFKAVVVGGGLNSSNKLFQRIDKVQERLLDAYHGI
jgi:uncharacterized protein with ParB-like and HNH nuclease domain